MGPSDSVRREPKALGQLAGVTEPDAFRVGTDRIDKLLELRHLISQMISDSGNGDRTKGFCGPPSAWRREKAHVGFDASDTTRYTGFVSGSLRGNRWVDCLGSSAYAVAMPNRRSGHVWRVTQGGSSSATTADARAKFVRWRVEA